LKYLLPSLVFRWKRYPQSESLEFTSINDPIYGVSHTHPKFKSVIIRLFAGPWFLKTWAACKYLTVGKQVNFFYKNNWRIEMTDELKTKVSNFDKLKMKKISKSESKHIRRLKETARRETVPEPIKKK
jgi:hypothetical protein